MARRKKGRPVNGILVLDKPSGITSNAALQKVKRLFDAQKAGHTGSLDPLASGVLPICLGEATKLSHYLLDAHKRYRAKCFLGTTTTTGDSEGEILEQRSLAELDEARLLDLLETFKGTQQQMPPMYSALKHNGRPLYEYARNGIEIERKSREITIVELNLLNFEWSPDNPDGSPFIELEVLCSKGTYIRSLCEDIGRALGCGAHIAELRRLEAEPFTLSQTVSLEQLVQQEDFAQRENLLLPVDSAIAGFPAVHLSSEEKGRIEHGHEIEFKGDSEHKAISEHKVLNNHKTGNMDFRLYFNNTLIALAVLDQNGKLKPKRLLFL